MSTVMMIAVETPLPPVSGSRLRTLHLARHLAAELPLRMAVLGPAGEADGEPFAVTGVPHHGSRALSVLRAVRRPYSAVKLHSDELAALVREQAPAVVQAQEVWLVPAALTAGRPVVLDAHNVEGELLESLGAAERRPAHRLRWRWEARKVADWERRRVREATAVCATSDADAEAFERYGAKEVVVVPNGVDTGSIAHREPAPGARLFYAGHYDYRPNVAAAFELAGEVLPRVRERVPAATLELVGPDPKGALERCGGPGVRVAGRVDDVHAHLHAARVVVVPLRSGSGTRLKVLEALAAGVPVVSTPLGVAGLAVSDGRDVLIGRSAGELADLAARVIADDALARRLSRAGRELVERSYDWRIAARPLIALHHRLGGG
jgi:polysaccharide biosynthesis protein PslH